MAWATWAAGAAALLLMGAHCAAIYTESLHWDELGLFYRAAETWRTGVIDAGGRPGLAAVLPGPLVRGCSDVLAVVHAGRWATAIATFAYVAGLFMALRSVLQGLVERPAKSALFGVALLVGVPIFHRWSVQVRSDQWCLALGLWGAVALIASQRKTWLAAIAGVLFGVGYLFTQKVAYVAGLALLLAAARQQLTGSFSWRRELARGAWLAAAADAVIAAFTLWKNARFTPRLGADNFEAAAFYRDMLGYGPYVRMLDMMIVHLIVVALMVFAFVKRPAPEHRRLLGFAALAIAMGLGVVVVHTSAFAYFWMTLGLFPAVAGALALEPIERAFSSRRIASLLTAAMFIALLAGAVPAIARRAADTQRVQRDAYAFIEASFPREAFGFHPEGGLFCRPDPDPFRFFFSLQLAYELKAPGAVDRFVQRFVDKPVSFLVATHRLNGFPKPVQRFWRDHYLLYGPAVMIPGFTLRAETAQTLKVSVIVPGEYRWAPADGAPAIELDGAPLKAGGKRWLARGVHEVRATAPFKLGFLALAMASPPRPAGDYYPADMLREITLRD